jgi:FkbM family methyltransferase
MIADFLKYAGRIARASVGAPVDLAGARVRIPGTLAIRLSVVAGNLRVQRLMDELSPGATVIDVGANIGYNTVYAATRVGPGGRVVAIEPAADNVRVLRQNIAANALDNVIVLPVAAGRAHESRTLFLRGDHSAVNSLFETSVYASVTGTETVAAAPLDDLVDGDADLVKIDVEGAEVEVLLGMTRLLALPRIRLIVEWHPRLQQAAGHSPHTLPRLLLERGFTLRAASHTRITLLRPQDVEPLATRLHASGRPVELVAQR